MAGATSVDVLVRQLGPAVASRPDLVTLSVGPNDLTGRVPPERYEQNIDSLAETLGSSGSR